MFSILSHAGRGIPAVPVFVKKNILFLALRSPGLVLEITCRCGVQCIHLKAVITGTNLKCPLPMAWTLQKEGMHSIKEKAVENRLNELVNDPQRKPIWGTIL